MHVDEQRQQRRGRRAQRVDLVERALEDVAGERGLAPGEVDRRQRAGRLDVGASMPVEQLLGLLEAPLPDAQVGQPDERAAAQRAADRGPTAATASVSAASASGQRPAAVRTPP